MVGSPIGGRVSSHRRTAAFRALRAIREISPIRERDGREARSRVRRDRERRTNAVLLRELREFFGLPVSRRHRRPDQLAAFDEPLPVYLQQPVEQPLAPPPVDWVLTVYALVTLAEREHHQQRQFNYPN